MSKREYRHEGALGNRQIWLDACRGFAMLLVLLGHNDPPFIRLLYGFHIPIFYLISGYLFKPGYKQAGFKETLIKILNRYIIPYYVLCFINLVLHYVILVAATDTWLNKAEILAYVKGILLVDYKNMPDCVPLWFLFSMGIARLLFWCIRRIKDIGIRLTIYSVGSVFWYVVWDIANVDGMLSLPFAIHTIWIGVIFMEIGYLVKQYGFIEKATNKSKSLRVSLVVNGLIVGIAAVALNRVEPRVDISYGNVGSIPLMFVGALGVSGSLMLLFRLLKDKRGLIPLAYVGKHTVFLMAFDWFSNTLGGQLLEEVFKKWNWCISFFTRLVILAVMLAIWQLIIKHIPESKFKRLIDI